MSVIHRYAAIDAAYRAIQTDPSVHDGHLIAVPNLHEVAVVCGDHAVAVDPATRVFPVLSDPEEWLRFAQGRYHHVVRLAECLITAWSVEPGDVPTATGAGTFRAVSDRIYGWGMTSFDAHTIAALACESYGADVITALNNILVVKSEWWLGTHGAEVRAFYASQPVLLPTRRHAS